MELRASLVPLSSGRRAVVVLRNIRERKAYDSALEHYALHDSLTGLANRVLFEDRLSHSVQTSQRDGRSFVVLLCDLDSFKAVNDDFGHDAGDMVLTTFSQRLRQLLRESDTIARIGGDEFAIIPHGAEEASDGARTAKAILQMLESPIHIKESDIAVNASIGIASYPTDGDRQTIVRAADMAMYAAKRSGTHYTVYASQLEGLLQNGFHSNGNGAGLRLPSMAESSRQDTNSRRRPGPNTPRWPLEPQDDA
jgi:diguanylate cyclase (GGDEF)-like protein